MARTIINMIIYHIKLRSLEFLIELFIWWWIDEISRLTFFFDHYLRCL